MMQFDALLPKVIDSKLGERCQPLAYSYSEIFRSLMCVFFCGSLCIKDISTNLMHHLSSNPKLNTCSADKMNELLVKSLLATEGLRSCQEYDLDFDHQFIQTEKCDAKRTYNMLKCLLQTLMTQMYSVKKGEIRQKIISDMNFASPCGN